jgi:hypothetical protein
MFENNLQIGDCILFLLDEIEERLNQRWLNAVIRGALISVTTSA